MILSLRNLRAGLAGIAVMLLAACGGGDGGGDAGSGAARPTAVATADRTSVPIGTAVTLDGSASTTPNGGTLRYAWTLSAKPEGSGAVLSGNATAKPTLTPDLPGDYAADLIVSDGTSSGSARVTITATSVNPLAVVIPAEQTVLRGATVVLDGSHSLAPTGGAVGELRYQWTLIEQPDNELITALKDATTAKASFLADRVGIYRASLVVRHGDKTSEPADVRIAVNTGNSLPVVSIAAPADAAYDRNGYLVFAGTLRRPVVLDGSGSKDPDGDALGYRWRFPATAAIPVGSKAAIVNADSAKAEFVPDVVGKYTFDFMAYDGHAATTQRVIVNVSKAADDTVNTAPVAGISGTGECELGGTSIYYPYCTIAAYASYDPEGDPLTYQWTYWNQASPGERLTSTASSVVLDGSKTGNWRFELVVSDGKLDSAVADYALSIKTGANVAPVASARVDVAKVLVGQTITFDGSASSDKNGDQLFYTWILERPAGSSAVLTQSQNDPTASVVADKPGPYIAFLQVKDSKGAISNRVGATTSASAFAKVGNNPPVLTRLSLQNHYIWYPNGNGGLDSGTTPGQPVIAESAPMFITSNVQYMFDPDQDSPLYYDISVVKQPEGASFPSYSCSTAAGERCHPNGNSLDLVVPGDYVVEARISDGVAVSEPKRVAFTVIRGRENYPTLLLERLPANDRDSDVDGNIQLFFPFTAAANARFSNVQPVESGATSLAVERFRLTAFDRDYTIVDLGTSSVVEGYQPVFNGLRNNQVIRKGDSVEFSLERPPIANEAGLHAAWTALGNTAEGNAEGARLQRIVDAYQFTWSFRVAEKEGYTLHRGPLN